MNQAGDREDCRAIRLFLKKQADGERPPFDLHYTAADDVTAAILTGRLLFRHCKPSGFLRLLWGRTRMY